MSSRRAKGLLQPRRGFSKARINSKHLKPSRAAIQGRDSGVGCKRC